MAHRDSSIDAFFIVGLPMAWALFFITVAIKACSAETAACSDEAVAEGPGEVPPCLRAP
jgi:hypothetical protein